MSFLKSIFNVFKPQTFAEKISAEHPTEWYVDNGCNLFMEILKTGNQELIESGLELYTLKYFESFKNIKALFDAGKRIDTNILCKELSCLILKVIDQYNGNIAHQAFFGAQLLKENENPYVRFVKKINHNFYGETAFYISQLIMLSYVDVDKDTWLYDTKLFDLNSKNDEDGSKLLKAITPILVEKNLFTQEIMDEIQENIK